MAARTAPAQSTLHYLVAGLAFQSVSFRNAPIVTFVPNTRIQPFDLEDNLNSGLRYEALLLRPNIAEAGRAPFLGLLRVLRI